MKHPGADVTEGSGGVWERLHYDWSDPHRVVLTTTDSNAWGGDHRGPGLRGETGRLTFSDHGQGVVRVTCDEEGEN